MFFNIFWDRVRTAPGTDFHRIWGPKMEPKSIQNRLPERSSRKCKILKKTLGFLMFFELRGGRKSIQNRLPTALKI